MMVIAVFRISNPLPLMRGASLGSRHLPVEVVNLGMVHLCQMAFHTV